MSEFNSLSKKYAISPEKISQAFSNLEAKKVVFYGFCGKIASGKDTVCLITQDMLAENYPQAVKISFSTVVRDEVNLIIERIKAGTTDTLAEELNVDKEKLDNLVSVLQSDSQYLSSEFSPYIHSLYMKDALHYWGTIVRREQDALYWARISAQRVIEALAAGYSVFVSDAKYACEIAVMFDLKAFVVFLEASEASRIRRLIARDGYRPDRSVLQHPGEVSIDSISPNRYNIVVSTEVNMASAIAKHILEKSKGR